MKAWHFSENAYPYLPPADEYPSIRVSLPNRVYDPEKGAALYDRFLDEWLIAEDEGMDIMLNEHHQTATCVDPAAPLVLAALARLSKKARLLILGNPIANRASQYAWLRRWPWWTCCRAAGWKLASCAACHMRCCRPTAIPCG